MRVGSLFSGVGGMDLGLERAGMRIVWQIEKEPYAAAVLARHFPHAVRHGDIRGCDPANLAPVDVLAGGFPCQDLSVAGAGAGLAGARSGLWGEFSRLIRALRPRYTVVENVPALIDRGLDIVLGDLAGCGYAAEWQVLSACMFGAPHTRERLFIVAYPDRECDGELQPKPFVFRASRPDMVAVPGVGDSAEPGWLHAQRLLWQAGPRVPRVADGIPTRMGQLRGYANAVVPVVAEYIGRLIMQHAQEN